MKLPILLSAPHMNGAEKKYVEEAFSTNWIAPLGPNIDAFENALSEYTGIDHAAALSSGTAAIHLALIMLGIDSGDDVIASSFTFSATVNPIVYQGATPVLIDCETDTWNMSPELLEAAIKDRLEKGRKVKAIIVVHLYGMPAEMDSVMRIATKYNIPVIEDAAEALGSRYNNRHVGSYGLMSILSFNGNKIITTSGGGALLSYNEEYIAKARFLATQARDNAGFYQHSQIGYNYRMSNVLAGIGRGQMESIGDRVEKRRENFNFYKKHLSDIEEITFLEEPDAKYFSNHWLTVISIDSPVIKCTIVQKELEKEGIEARRLWKPMHMQPVFAGCPSFINGNSEKLFANGLCLPSGSNLEDNDMLRVINVIRRIFKK